MNTRHNRILSGLTAKTSLPAVWMNSIVDVKKLHLEELAEIVFVIAGPPVHYIVFQVLPSFHPNMNSTKKCDNIFSTFFVTILKF